MPLNSVQNNYLKVFFPTFFTVLTTFLFVLTDTMFISNLGENQLAGIGLAGTFMIFASAIFDSIAQAVGVNVSKAYGAKFTERIKTKIFSGLILMSILGFLFTMLFFTFHNEILSIFNASSDVLVHTTDYYNIWIYSIFFMALSSYFSTLLNNLGLNKKTTYITISGVFLNILLNYIFIYGIEGIIEPMGVGGAALGTMLTFTYYTIVKGSYLHYKNYFKVFKMNNKKLKSITIKNLKLSLHFLVGGILYPISAIVFNSVISNYPNEVIASFTLANSLKLLLFSVAFSTSSSLMILSSRYLGNKDIQSIKETFQLTFKILLSWIIVVMTISLTLSHEVGSIFLSSDTALENFDRMWWIILTTSSTWAIASNLTKFFIALNKPKYSSYINFFGNILSIIFPAIFSYYYGFMAFISSVAIIGLMTMFISYFTYKTKIKNIVFR